MDYHPILNIFYNFLVNGHNHIHTKTYTGGGKVGCRGRGLIWAILLYLHILFVWCFFSWTYICLWVWEAGKSRLEEQILRSTFYYISIRETRGLYLHYIFNIFVYTRPNTGGSGVCPPLSLFRGNVPPWEFIPHPEHLEGDKNFFLLSNPPKVKSPI